MSNAELKSTTLSSFPGQPMRLPEDLAWAVEQAASYLNRDEERHFSESSDEELDQGDHIYRAVVVLKSWADQHDAAVATGKDSGIWVLDLDPGHDDDTEFIRLLRNNGGLLPTFRQHTPRGGEHYFFRFNGEEIKSRTKIGGEPIGSRGVGGYIVLAPSQTKDGEYIVVDENATV